MTSRKDSPGIFNRFKVLQKSAKLSLECHKLLKISSHRQSKAFTDQKLKGDWAFPGRKNCINRPILLSTLPFVRFRAPFPFSLPPPKKVKKNLKILWNSFKIFLVHSDWKSSKVSYSTTFSHFSIWIFVPIYWFQFWRENSKFWTYSKNDIFGAKIQSFELLVKW